ncbi:unnamed protein product [Meloidogyne enterolobii]|uniref:Uncharacterized protein n=1 Tax=Meloidogyne enterolobii TaxID=390850 RepID=A0ACB0YEB5_MELEN
MLIRRVFKLFFCVIVPSLLLPNSVCFIFYYFLHFFSPFPKTALIVNLCFCFLLLVFLSSTQFNFAPASFMASTSYFFSTRSLSKIHSASQSTITSKISISPKYFNIILLMVLLQYLILIMMITSIF